MVRKVALLGLAALVFSALSTNLAGARSEAVCKPKCLQALVTDLEEQLQDLEDEVADLEDEVADLGDGMDAAADYVDYFDDCLWVTPMTSYGDNVGGEYGYYYSSNGGQTSFLTSALDFTVEGDFVHAWVFYDNCEDYDSPLSAKRVMKVSKPISRSR